MVDELFRTKPEVARSHLAVTDPPAAGSFHVVDHHRPVALGQPREHVVGIPRRMAKLHRQPRLDLGPGEFRVCSREKRLKPIFVDPQRRRKLKEDASELRAEGRELIGHAIEFIATIDEALAMRYRLAGDRAWRVQRFLDRGACLFA
jgi:hypothetical protein